MFHGGAALLAWLMARAAGGPGRLAPLCRACAYLLPVLPLLAPGSAAPGEEGLPLPGLAACRALAGLSAVLWIAALYRLLRVTQGATVRSALAAALFTLFSGPILLLA